MDTACEFVGVGAADAELGAGVDYGGELESVSAQSLGAVERYKRGVL